MMRTAASSMVVLALIAGASAGCSAVHSDGPRAAVGEVFSADLSDAATSGVVQVPWGTITIKATSVTEQLPQGLYSEKHQASYEQIAAPQGGGFLGVDVESSYAQGPDAGLVRATTDARLAPTSISIQDGSRSYPVAQSRGGTGNVGLAALVPSAVTGYLSLAGRPRTITVAVTFDGVTQTLELGTAHRVAGRAAPLYARPAATTKRRCGTPTWSAPYRPEDADAQCTLDAVRTVPYVAGLGWARPDRPWLVTIVDTVRSGDLLRSGQGKTARYFIGGLIQYPTTCRYAGRPAASSGDFNSLSLSFGRLDVPFQFVFATPADAASSSSSSLTITTFFEATLVNDVRGAPAHPKVSATWTVRIP